MTTDTYAMEQRTTHSRTYRLGPAIGGEYHGVGTWGIHIETDRPLHLGSATIDVRESGTLTIIIAEYDGESMGKEVFTKSVPVPKGESRVGFGVELDPGSYILTKDDTLALRRREWGGWGEQLPGVTYHGGASGAEWDGSEYWYYYFDLHNTIRSPGPLSRESVGQSSERRMAKPVTRPEPPTYAEALEGYFDDQYSIQEFEQLVDIVLAREGWDAIEEYETEAN